MLTEKCFTGRSLYRLYPVVTQTLCLVLITSNDRINPQYSYPLSDEMVVGFSFSKPSLVKCQIITGNIERDVVRRLGTIKAPYFNEIVDKIVESIF